MDGLYILYIANNNWPFYPCLPLQVMIVNSLGSPGGKIVSNRVAMSNCPIGAVVLQSCMSEIVTPMENPKKLRLMRFNI